MRYSPCTLPWGLAVMFVAALLQFSNCGFRMSKAQIQKCHEKCAKCHLFDYSKEWHCVQCMPGYTLWVDGCFLPCPRGEFRYGYKCMKCGMHCDECVGPLNQECTKCTAGYHLSWRGTCIKDCPPGQYSMADGSGCGKCNAYCRRCIAEYLVSCTRCYEGYTLKVHEHNTKSGECMQNCRDPYFRDSADDLRCIQCGEYCLSCNSLYNCTKCEAGCTLHNGICYATADVAVNEGISFEKYLQSGAGKQWTGDGPDWKAVLAESQGR